MSLPTFTHVIDEPARGAAVDFGDFEIRGWLAAEAGADFDVTAVEAWLGGRRLSVTSWLYPRVDVAGALKLPETHARGFIIPKLRLAAPGALRVVAQTARGEVPLTVVDLSAAPQKDTPRSLLSREAGDRAVGIELGAHVNPVPGVAPFYADYTVNFAAQEGRVDLLADGMALPFPDGALDYLCSSHVIEHLPNPLGGLYEWLRVLRPGGLLYLVVPDKRYTFDVGRPITPPEHLLADYLRATTSTQRVAQHIEEFTQLTDWKKLQPACPPEREAEQRAELRRAYLQEVAAGRHVDIHFHTFTPESLAALLHRAGITGRDGAAEIVVQEEQYPAARADGIGLLLRKRPGPTPARAEPAGTHHLRNAHGAALPLVCPATLHPLTLQRHSPAHAPTLVAGHRQYAYTGPIPDLRPHRSDTVRRDWATLSRRLARYAAARFRG